MNPSSTTTSGPPAEQPAPPPGTVDHEEWLIDEALDETFPASDAPTFSGSPTQARSRLLNQAEQVVPEIGSMVAPT